MTKYWPTTQEKVIKANKLGLISVFVRVRKSESDACVVYEYVQMITAGSGHGATDLAASSVGRGPMWCIIRMWKLQELETLERCGDPGTVLGRARQREA